MARERFTYCKKKYLNKRRKKKYVECLIRAIMRYKTRKKIKKKMLIFLLFLNKKHKWTKQSYVRKLVKENLKKLERRNKK